MKRRTKVLLSLTLIIAIYVFVYFSELYMDPFIKRILNTGLIYAILGVSLNLINGFTGQFSLGHAGFMAIGAYASALLYMSPENENVELFHDTTHLSIGQDSNSVLLGHHHRRTHGSWSWFYRRCTMFES